MKYLAKLIYRKGIEEVVSLQYSDVSRTVKMLLCFQGSFDIALAKAVTTFGGCNSLENEPDLQALT